MTDPEHDRRAILRETSTDDPRTRTVFPSARYHPGRREMAVAERGVYVPSTENPDADSEPSEHHEHHPVPADDSRQKPAHRPSREAVEAAAPAPG